MKRRLDAASRQRRHQDLQALTELGISARKLLTVVDRLRSRRELLQVPVNLQNIRDAQQEVFIQVAETRNIILDDGSEFDLEICHFGKLLDVMSSECSEFGNVLRTLQTLDFSSMEKPMGFDRLL